MSEAVGKDIPYQILPRRAGDIAVCYSDGTKAKKNWTGRQTMILNGCVKIIGAGKANIQTVLRIRGYLTKGI